ncbi:histidine kinase inhibitor antagonist [Bordetella ansorpii]|uniref:Histidine kinase inhibitor antagonist n=1 Tax=Bordetella ansorpii TaxID=288768 RepID=A0A157SBE1_9BORD|nr:biotin-dependent carboxyltransferase family protein [Bordetella ansorpii]SAI67760.1 histidine kinase inhibitor antagonist [Bordetella ansorpii]
MSLTVLKPGMLSSFQDDGRTGWQHLGVPVAGAMDERAHRLANLLVGNPAGHASLEITLVGPTLRFDAPACVAIGGADLGATLNGIGIPPLRPMLARAGDVLTFSSRPRHERGVRAYLAVHGGYAIDPVMGSESTYLRSGFGGWHGRPLAREDRIGLHAALRGNDTALDKLADALDDLRIYLPAPLVHMPREALRVLPGAHWEAFDETSRQRLVQAVFQISPQSDRMGYRLSGPNLSLGKPREMLSEAASFGTIQVPAGGQPIILMADRQTTGGYPKIAQVASADLPLLAQYAPGQALRFAMIGLEEAQRLDNARERAYRDLEHSLQALRGMLAQHTSA